VKAIAQNAFGDAEVLSLQELPDPLVGPDQVLVRVHTAGVNPVDRGVRAGYLQSLYPHHFPLIPGWDMSGVVVSTGPAVVGFAPGDEVYGYQRKDHVQHGTYAELIAATTRGLAHKPTSMTFEQAGGFPLCGLTAVQSLRAVGVGPGDTVLVHAAAGGVGPLAVQIAQVLGAARRRRATTTSCARWAPSRCPTGTRWWTTWPSSSAVTAGWMPRSTAWAVRR
jgi:NADPH:quinone reductase-like Zn-dependent oxidoreductase